MPGPPLDRRAFVAALAATALVPPAQAAPGPAAQLYARAIVIDALGAPGGYDPALPEAKDFTPRHFADIRASGLTAVNVTVGAIGNLPDAFEQSVRDLASYTGAIHEHADVFAHIRTAADLAKAKSSGRLGLIFGFQDSAPFGTDLDRVGTFAELGVRIVQPVYNRRNLMVDGCLEPGDGGLSVLGRALVERLDSERLLVDMSHAGPRTQADAIAAAKRPRAITHTGCRALADLPRDTHDAQLRALADKGGVAGIYFMPFLRRSGQPRSAEVIRHIEHAWNIMGEDHVGIGTDGAITGLTLDARSRKEHRDFIETRRKAGISAPGEDPEVFLYVPEYNTPRRFEILAADLLARRHSTARVEKLIGGSFARLFADVWG